MWIFFNIVNVYHSFCVMDNFHKRKSIIVGIRYVWYVFLWIFVVPRWYEIAILTTTRDQTKHLALVHRPIKNIKNYYDNIFIGIAWWVKHIISRFVILVATMLSTVLIILSRMMVFSYLSAGWHGSLFFRYTLFTCINRFVWLSQSVSNFFL